MNCPVCGTWHETTACNPNHTRHGCGPGAALPEDTVTEGARLPRRTREELVREFDDLFDTSREEWMKGIFGKTDHWEPQHKRLQRLADLAGQIAGMED